MINTYDRLLLHDLRIGYFPEEHFEKDDERGVTHDVETLLVVFIYTDGSVTRREFDDRHQALAWIAQRRGEKDVLMMCDNRNVDPPERFTTADFRERFERRKM